MKRYILAAVAVVLLGAGVWLYVRRYSNAAVPVRIVSLQTQTVQRTVSCGGKIEASAMREVYADIPCVLGEIHVTEGQRVRAGDRLITTDRSATGQALQSVGITVNPDDLPECVTAPVSGVIKDIKVQAGNVVDTETVVAHILPDAQVQVSVQIPEQVMREVAVGQRVVITGVAFARDTYSGTLTEIADTAHTVTGSSAAQTVVDAVIALDEDCIDDSLRSGLTAKATITVQTLENALIVPYSCILQDDSGEEYVLAVEQGYAVRRRVYIARELTEGCLLSGGPTAGAQLILSPDGVAAGARVEVIHE